MGLVRAIYNWANATGRLEVNPTLGLKKRNAAKPRDRILSDTELRILWQALDTSPKLSDEIRTALKLEILLGVRIASTSKQLAQITRHLLSTTVLNALSGSTW